MVKLLKKRPLNDRVCINCNKNFKSVSREKILKFCSIDCKTDYNRKKIVNKWLSGEITGACSGKYGNMLTAVHEYVLDKSDRTCEVCGNSKWNNKPIPIQVHHIDGNANNNNVNNLQAICWNCHAQTKTFGSKNKNGTRASRYK